MMKSEIVLGVFSAALIVLSLALIIMVNSTGAKEFAHPIDRTAPSVALPK